MRRPHRDGEGNLDARPPPPNSRCGSERRSKPPCFGAPKISAGQIEGRRIWVGSGCWAYLSGPLIKHDQNQAFIRKSWKMKRTRTRSGRFQAQGLDPYVPHHRAPQLAAQLCSRVEATAPLHRREGSKESQENFYTRVKGVSAQCVLSF